jgi:N-acetylglucosamine-6-phosphate deacetylase
MEGVHHRQPGPLGALMDSATTTAEIIADGNHIHPSVLKMAYRLLGRDRLILITDSTGMGSLKNGNYHFGAIGDFTVRNGSSYFPDGRLIGTNIPLISMCANMKKWAGATFEETAQMATFNPARLLGEKLGEIRIGYPADLILTDEKFSLYGVWIGGKKI